VTNAPLFRRLTLRSATGTAQRAFPYPSRPLPQLMPGWDAVERVLTTFNLAGKGSTPSHIFIEIAHLLAFQQIHPVFPRRKMIYRRR